MLPRVSMKQCRKHNMIYRAVRNPKTLHVAARTTLRPPGMVPYFVDNIWEWLRPANMPTRRSAAFASPSAELAANAIGGSLEDVYMIELLDGQMAVQLVRSPDPSDAKYHNDLKRLRNVVLRESLGDEWAGKPLNLKGLAAALFTPCLSKKEVAEILGNSEYLNAAKIRAASTFWDDVKWIDPDDVTPSQEGEIFFSGAYKLMELQY